MYTDESPKVNLPREFRIQTPLYMGEKLEGGREGGEGRREGGREGGRKGRREEGKEGGTKGKERSEGCVLI